MLCRKKCFVGSHVLWSACLQDGISYNMLCFTRRHVLMEDMFLLRVCYSGTHVVVVVLSFMILHVRVGHCVVGGHVL